MRPAKAFITLTLELDPTRMMQKNQWSNPELELEWYIQRLTERRHEIKATTIRAVAWEGFADPEPVKLHSVGGNTSIPGGQGSSAFGQSEYHPRLRCVGPSEVLRDLPEGSSSSWCERTLDELRESLALPGKKDS